ncbi:hypothetical protein CHH28_18765 [Bacterioplanes sanyensis]|uniref:Flagellar hook-length control protein-like C-terminal domain-containing protein n=1 Tax=Bacterioplanes sanyensis TaxID=1249553 RepID=A0A222FPZ3_9GAMM|nr:flagellar hook-length control protein FliK [Bacterioplanes sanyensis]ASP40584.1 hypothetical protein CHH28_18765 [Bacterioplanes sanyensis]
MMQSGGSGLNGLLMSLGATLPSQADGSLLEAMPVTDTEFSRLFEQLRAGSDALPLSMQQAGLDSEAVIEWTDQDWLQLEHALTAAMQEGDSMPQLPPGLPLTTKDLLQQVRFGEGWATQGDADAADSESAAGLLPTTTAQNDLRAAFDGLSKAVSNLQPGEGDAANKSANDLSTTILSDSADAANADVDDLGLAALTKVQHSEALPANQNLESDADQAVQNSAVPAAANGLAASALTRRDLSVDKRATTPGQNNPASSDAAMPDLSEASSSEPKPHSTINVTDTVPEADTPSIERPIAQNTAAPELKSPQQTMTQPTAIAAVPSDTVNSNELVDPLTEEAFELQEKRELQQVRGEERLRDKLELGPDRQTWGAALGGRIMTMVQDDIQQARIHLDPPELGSLEIRLQVQQDQTNIQVQVQNPQVRDALEANAHRLREALAENGLSLAGFDVSEQGSQQQQGFAQSSAEYSSSNDEMASDDDLHDAPSIATSSTNSQSLLDTFA